MNLHGKKDALQTLEHDVGWSLLRKNRSSYETASRPQCCDTLRKGKRKIAAEDDDHTRNGVAKSGLEISNFGRL